MDGQEAARDLEEDDVEGLCFLYADLAVGDGELGAACSESDDCLDGLFCLADGTDRYCSLTCTEDSECGDGYACLDLGDGTQACAVEEDKADGCGGCTSHVRPAGTGWLFGLMGLWFGFRLRERAPQTAD